MERTPGFDVMMEVWFDNYYSMEAAMADMSTEAAQRELAEDEEQLFDRDRTQSFIVDECESDWMTTIEMTAQTGDCGILVVQGPADLSTTVCRLENARASKTGSGLLPPRTTAERTVLDLISLT